MSTRKLTLFIPGLLGSTGVGHTPGALDGLALAALERILARADRHHVPERGVTAALLGLFGITPQDELPVAALTRRLDMGETENDGHWLRADPVHVRADRDRLVMLGNRHLNVRADEAAQLAAEFNRLFEADGLHLEAPQPERWYMRLTTPTVLHTWPLPEVVGRDVDPHLPTGADALHWHQLLNEIQMLFHASPVNRERETHGQPTINSVWFWGGGALPASPSSPWTRVWSHDALAQASARHAGVAASPAPAAFEDWQEQASEAGVHLLTLDGAVEAIQFGDIGRWRDFITAVDDAWLAPALAALQRGQLSELKLVTAEGESFVFTPRALRRWWRRSRPLKVYLA